jgi:hypothetical protein
VASLFKDELVHFAALKQCLFSCISGKIGKAIDYNGKVVNKIVRKGDYGV